MNFNIILESGKERPILRRHPWVYSTAIKRVEGNPKPGATVQILTEDGRWIAKGAYSPQSKIRVRAWSWDEKEAIDHAFFKRKIRTALHFRQQWIRNTNAIRLIAGEADGIPGLIVDQYNQAIVCQFLSVGVELWRDAIITAIREQTQCQLLVERSDSAVRAREGLPEQSAILFGDHQGELISVNENGVCYGIDVMGGHKTGFYIDQRANRQIVSELSKDRRVLNMFCYTGGFSLAALQGGAKSVMSVDSSADALALARQHMTMNGFALERATWHDADAFTTLSALRNAKEKFDLIILDPPKFAPSVQHLDRALKAYKEINRAALQLLSPGGLLLTFSCSGAVSPERFEQMIVSSASEALAHMQDPSAHYRIMRRLAAGLDHPVLTSFPEGEYLKGLLLQRVE
jgi:23S rRNA (cytosine1962-C5)-methyltransferase